MAISSPVKAEKESTFSHNGFVDEETGITVRLERYDVSSEGYLVVAMAELDIYDNTLWFQSFSPVQCSMGEAYYQGILPYPSGKFVPARKDGKPVYARNFYQSKLAQDKNLVLACQAAKSNGFRLK
ncbi:MAG: hypothetical protein V7K89_21000 [Nostoc sp.]|uniref:hypothetical protein n=1 Tax=Nostoc sp. TaxID=1180 RepID=UPI002FFB5E1D